MAFSLRRGSSFVMTRVSPSTFTATSWLRKGRVRVPLGPLTTVVLAPGATVTVTPLGMAILWTVSARVGISFTSVDVRQQATAGAGLLGPVLVDHATRGGQDERAEVARREEAGLPGVELVLLDGVAGLDDAAVVDGADQRDLVEAAAAVVLVLERADVGLLLHDLEDAADQLAGGRDGGLGLAGALRVAEDREGVCEGIVLHGCTSGVLLEAQVARRLAEAVAAQAQAVAAHHRAHLAAAAAALVDAVVDLAFLDDKRHYSTTSMLNLGTRKARASARVTRWSLGTERVRLLRRLMRWPGFSRVMQT